MQDNKPFGERLKAERIRLGLTQPAMAALGKVSKASQVAYESGATAPDAVYLSHVTVAGVDTLFLFTGVAARLAAGQVLDWILIEQLLDCVQQFENRSGKKLSPAIIARLLRVLYSGCAPLNRVEQGLVEAALANAA